MWRLFICIVSIAILPGCSKKESDNNVNKESKFSFEFNGTKYDDPASGAILTNSGALEGIIINRPDLFGGSISFYRNSTLSNNCAFLTPTGLQYYLQQPGCILNATTGVDSVLVYFYRSGEMNYSRTNCQHKKEPDAVFGGFLEYDVCNVTGTFNLTLGNKNNQTIVITKGSFSFYGVKF